MKLSGVEIRPGNNIEYDGRLWRAVKIQHTQPGKGGAYMQVELKNLIDGRKNNVRFRSAETVERIRLDTKDFQYLYAEGDMLVFMDTETYEQINLPQDLVGDAAAFLQDGMMVMLEMYEERPISVQLPETVEATVVEADAVVKGQTASASYKPAILDNGVRVMVPPHIVTGTRIVRDGFQSPTPLTVLTLEDIQNSSPSNNIADFVNQLPPGEGPLAARLLLDIVTDEDTEMA